MTVWSVAPAISSSYASTTSSSSFSSSFPSSFSSSSKSSEASTFRLIQERPLSSRLTSEYARTSEELVGYVNHLECGLERAREEIQRLQQEAVDARNHATLVARHLTIAHKQVRDLADEKDQALATARTYKGQLHAVQSLLADEQSKIQCLESQIIELEKISKKKDEQVEEFKSKERKRRKTLRKQNENLMRKATLSWILACLSNPYLEEDTSKERTESLTRMALDLLKADDQSRRAVERSFTYSDMKARSLQLECAYVENEIRRLLQPSSLTSQNSEECHSNDIRSKTPELSTSRFCLSSEVGQEGISSSRRDRSKGCSRVRSILKEAQNYFDDDGKHECGSSGRQCFSSRELIHSMDSRDNEHGREYEVHGFISNEDPLENKELSGVEGRSRTESRKAKDKDCVSRSSYHVPRLSLSGSSQRFTFEDSPVVYPRSVLQA
ncbi:hypothetical protein KP509_14G092200 [Ceratopteris richardii]|uniref:Uncharacterized protein n=1 Tax=Ceratopteris richardii TaxID=49495 RepID=A0A8T2TCF8_CERRI|nr:hypothetical protein KP509_14G092200 [Ceratopteris richardii]